MHRNTTFQHNEAMRSRIDDLTNFLVRFWRGHGRPQDFSRGGQIRGSGNETPSARSRGGALVGVWGQSPRSRQKLWK